MKNSLMTMAVLAGSMALVSAADVTGKVTLKGEPKPEGTIDMKSDPKCGALHTAPVTTRHYVVGKEKGLANVFVYVKTGLEGKTFEAPADSPLLNQVGCEYQPYVIGAQVNQKVRIRNSDALMHNVHAQPKASSGNKEFNFSQVVKGQVNEKTFANPEVLLKMKCDVHPWMFGYIGVVAHPFFAVTDKDGNFKISNLPPGKYTLEAYHLKAHGANPGVTQEVTVDGNKAVTFEVEVKPAP